jgi:hypothetical protein
MNHRILQPHRLIPAPAGLSASGRPSRWLLSSDAPSDGQDDTVVVRRRRPSGQSDGGPRERADAPQRRRPDAGSGSGSSRPSGGGGGGGLGLPFRVPRGGGKGCGCGLPPALTAIGLVVLAILFIVFILLPGGEEAPADTPVIEDTATVAPTAAAAVSATPRPAASATPRPAAGATSVSRGTPAPAVAPGKQKWLVMLYEDADDKILEEDMYFDVNEAERVGSTDRVQIVAQVDRYRAGFQGDGNWTSARRFYITKDNDLSRIASKQIADLGEVNMGDPKTLTDFVVWAVGQYPADKYVLILSDHGTGWPGGYSDPAPAVAPRSNVPLVTSYGNMLYLMDLDTALGDIRSRAGLDKFELIGMDACLMSHIEVYAMLAPHARYAVASQETEPALGWAYASFLNGLTRNPDMSGADLAKSIVQTYLTEDQRIVDPQARAEFLRQGSPMGDFSSAVGGPSPAQLAAEIGDTSTLAALDLSAVPALVNNLNDFAGALSKINQTLPARARTYALSFESVFGRSQPSYIDLGNFALLMQQNANDAEVTRASKSLIAGIRAAVLAEKHGPKKKGATGISIYFPTSALYRAPESGPRSYTAIAKRFAQDSVWDDFLAFHYAGRAFETTTRAPAVPDAGAAVRGPGAGNLQLSAVQLSSATAAPGQPITLRATVRGQNVGYAYLFAGYYDQAANSIQVADTDYLEAPNQREADGVYYPNWGDREQFTLQFEWEPLMFAISDGTRNAQALLTPRSYGAAPELAVYSVAGIYHYADGESRYASLYFSNGLLRQVFGFTGTDFAGSPHEITPQTGDKFTVLEKWLDLDAGGKIVRTDYQEGQTLTFGSKTFTWKQLDAAAGDYIVGFIVDDLDGVSAQTYARVQVR